MSTSSSSSVLLLIFWAASTTTLTTTTILQIAEATNINDQPTVHCSQNSVCPNTYPICCSGFCVSAGSYCCGSNNCDPGQQCCAVSGECCSPGSSCGVRGCVKDIPCSTYTDPGLCLSPFKPEVSPNNATTTTPTTGCVWSCTDRRCMSSADATRPTTNDVLTSLEDQCPNACNNAFTCQQCINGTHFKEEGAGGDGIPCYWCAASQQCSQFSSSDCGYMTLVPKMDCSLVLFGGAGIYPSPNQDDDKDGSNMGWAGSHYIVFTLALVVVALVFMVIKMLSRVRRSSRDGGPAATTDPLRRRSSIEAGNITGAVPRFGFEEDEEIRGMGPSKETSPLLQEQQQNAGDREDAYNTTTTSKRCCSVCKVATGGESKRNFIVASEKEQEKVASWSYVVALPCNHKLCKKCLIDAQTAKTISRGILQKAGGVFSQIRAAADISENAATVEAPPAVVPLGDEDVSSAAVLAALGDNHACLCCTSMVKCVFIPSKMLK